MDPKKIQLFSQQPTELIIKGIRPPEPEPVELPVKDQQGETDSGQSAKLSPSQEILKPVPAQDSGQPGEPSPTEGSGSEQESQQQEAHSADIEQILASDATKQDSSTQTNETSFYPESHEESNKNQEHVPDFSTQTNIDVILQTGEVLDSKLVERTETELNLESDSNIQVEKHVNLESASEEIKLKQESDVEIGLQFIETSEIDVNIRVSIKVEEEIINAEYNDNAKIHLQPGEEIESVKQPSENYTEEKIVKSDEQDINTDSSLQSQQEITQNLDVKKDSTIETESNDSDNDTESVLQSSDAISPPIEESVQNVQEGLATSETLNSNALDVIISDDIQLRDATDSQPLVQDSETVGQTGSPGSATDLVQVDQQASPRSTGAIPRTSRLVSQHSDAVAGPSGISRRATRPQGLHAHRELLRRRFMHPMTYHQQRQWLAECLYISRLQVPSHLHATPTRARVRPPRGGQPTMRRPRREDPYDRGEDREPARERVRTKDTLINGPPFIENGWMGNVTPCDYSTAHRDCFRQVVTRPRRLAVPPAVLRTGYGYSNSRPSFETTQRAHFRDPEQLYAEQHAARRSRSLSPMPLEEKRDAVHRSNSQSPRRPVPKQ